MYKSSVLAQASLSALLMSDVDETYDASLRYGFQIGNLNLIYDKQIASELVKSSKIYPIPNTPHWMLGLINLRGSLVPVFNLERYFGFETPVDYSQLIFVLGKGEKAVAVHLKNYPQLLSHLTRLDTLPELNPKIQAFIVAAYQGEKIWLELDKEKFFSTLGVAVCK
jgi:twitching motility protein PilI